MAGFQSLVDLIHYESGKCYFLVFLWNRFEDFKSSPHINFFVLVSS
jgi:hypothetical protein